MPQGRDPSFYLDHDVDLEVAKLLRNHRFKAVAAYEVGLDAATDTEQNAYARKNRFVLVTNDKEFTARQRQSPLGQHLRIKGESYHSAEILEQHLDKIAELLRTDKDMTVEVSRTKVNVTFTPGSTNELVNTGKRRTRQPRLDG